MILRSFLLRLVGPFHWKTCCSMLQGVQRVEVTLYRPGGRPNQGFILYKYKLSKWSLDIQDVLIMVQPATNLQGMSASTLVTFCSLEKPCVGRRNSLVILGSAWESQPLPPHHEVKFTSK